MKNKIISILFCLFIGGFLIANMVIPDRELSISERRKLAKLPDITMESIIKGELFDSFEEYALDQFVLRDEFRNLKVRVEFNLLGKKDSNNLYYNEGYIFKIEYPLKEQKVELFAQKINNLYDKYLKGMNVYYSIIPDKNYYSNDDYLKMDYDKLIDIVNNKMNNNIKYIDIRDGLDLSKYYYTDIHWKQEELNDVVKILSLNMNFNLGSNYIYNEYNSFYGSYYGQIGLKVKPDIIFYLSNDVINSALVKDYESNLDKVYEVESLGKIDSYDVYLGGASALIELTNTMTDSEKELIIFRDSFGSSIAPLMLSGYKKITLVDLRYMSSNLLEEYINFNKQDILFLYNTTIVNNSDMIK